MSRDVMSPGRPWLPRASVHRGRVEVAALGFSPARLGEAEARRRVLALWSPGVEVFALDEGYLVRLADPLRLDCARAPGLPFVRERGVLLSAPLTPTERERLAPPPDSLVWVHAGGARVHAPGTWKRVDVAAWLDVAGWEVVRARTLGAPPPPVPLFVPVAAPSRADFGLGAPSAEAERMRALMAGRPPPAPPPARTLLERWRAAWRWARGASSSPAAGSAPTSASTVRPGLLARVLAALGSRAARGPGPAAPAPAPSGPGPLARLAQWLIRSTPLARLVGERQADYVRRLFDLFDDGDLEEALRHAIPLGKGAATERARVALGLPAPREQLVLQPRGGRAASVFLGAQGVYAALRERYRAAFQKMEREGRIEEAAFVLADLLDEAEEAVSFLERHGRARLAAELAEGRALAPGLVVRQWVLARDVARAVDVARRTGAFADAVLRLGRTHPAEARALRLLWAEVLARAGDYPGAVDAAWPMEESRRLIWEWVARGVEVGGLAGARSLARGVALFPEHFESLRAGVLALCAGEGREEAQARLLFAGDLVALKTGGAAREASLRRAVRVLLRDRAEGLVPLEGKELKGLVQHAADPVLTADLPPAPSRAPLPTGGTVEGDFGEDVGGPWPLHDAVPLENGRVLVALGELGARLLTRDGRCVAHFDVPAFSLVVSWRRDRALALAPRGTLQRVSRLDLARRRAEPWCDVRADVFAPEYDGERWFIGEGDTLLALDALADAPRALWRVPGMEGRLVRISVGPEGLDAVCERLGAHGTFSLERWLYTYPALTLRLRTTLPREERGLTPGYVLAVHPGGVLAVLDEARDGTKWMNIGFASSDFPSGPLDDTRTVDLKVRAHRGLAWLDQAPGERPGLRLRVFQRPGAELLVRLHLWGEHPGARLRDVSGSLLVFDQTGWLVRVEPERREFHRISPR